MTQTTTGGEDGSSQQPFARLISQLALLTGDPANGGVDGLTVWPPQWQQVGYEWLGHADRLLTRDADAARVVAALREGGIDARPRERGEEPPGVTVVELPTGAADQPSRRDRLSAALALVDPLGPGVATPDHFFHVAGAGGGVCPATEPEPVHGPCDPSPPPVCPDAGSGVRVVVLDSGFIDDAQALSWMQNVKGEPDPGYDPNAGRIAVYSGHGTFGAGVLACVAPAAAIEVLSSFDRSSVVGVYESELRRALPLALALDPHVLSMAFGTYTRDDMPALGLDLLQQAVENNPGLVLVSAAGNDDDTRPFLPAGLPWSVGVGALDRNWTGRAHFSNHGPWVDVYAPGEDLVNAFASGTYTCIYAENAGQQRHFTGMARWSGTSFSTPLVAGLVAARIAATGASPQQAVDSLVRQAVEQGIPGVGPALYPDDCGRPGRGCGCGSGCGCGCGGGRRGRRRRH